MHCCRSDLIALMGMTFVAELSIAGDYGAITAVCGGMAIGGDAGGRSGAEVASRW